MFKGHPKGLFVLALANMGERFGYYTMLAIFVLFMQAKFGFSADTTSTIFGIFLAAVYFLPGKHSGWHRIPCRHAPYFPSFRPCR